MIKTRDRIATMSENRNVIVNADDLGARESVNHAIVHLLEQGLINRATMLANFPGFDQAVQIEQQKGLNSPQPYGGRATASQSA